METHSTPADFVTAMVGDALFAPAPGRRSNGSMIQERTWADCLCDDPDPV